MKTILQVFLLALSFVAVAAADEPISDAAGAQLMAKYNCQSCHSMNKSSLPGPALRDIAKRYASDLSFAERTRLEATARKYTSPYRDVIRAKIVLYAAQGLDNDAIAARLDTPRHCW